MAGQFNDLLPPLTIDDIALMDDELSQLRAMAGRGESQAKLGGPVMAWWGCVIALAALAIIGKQFELLPARFPVTIFEFGFGYLGSVIYYRTRKTKGTGKMFFSWQTSAISTIWVFAGIAIFLFVLGCDLTDQGNGLLITAFLSFIFGLVIAVIGSAGRRKWLLLPAAGWMGTGFAIFFFGDVITRQCLFGAAAVLFMLLPGLKLSLNEKRT